MDVWQFRIRNLRKKLKGWSRNIEAARVKRKKEIILEIDRLDILMEQSSPTVSQRVDSRKMKEELEKI
jgi:hypothetical protein